MFDDAIRPGDHGFATAPDHTLLCTCTVRARLEDDGVWDGPVYDWFIRLGDDDRWVAFHRVDQQLEWWAVMVSDAMNADHHWRSALFGRPLHEVLDAPDQVSDEQLRACAAVPDRVVRRLRRARSEQVEAAFARAMRVPASAPIPALPRDPFLHQVQVADVTTPSIARRLHRAHIHTLLDVERSNHEQLLGIPGIGPATVRALSDALARHGTAPTTQSGAAAVPYRASDERLTMWDEYDATGSIAKVAAAWGTSRAHVREVLTMPRPGLRTVRRADGPGSNDRAVR
ncbi:MAG: hypothetical protein M0P31_18045 [Solirubrobacteraceae bacterium]|nr:hypothetical protein [Solirubrobacteraceae bacterium]